MEYPSIADVIVFCGRPGAGKSTLADGLSRVLHNAKLFNTQQWRIKLTGNNPLYTSAEHEAVDKIMRDQAAATLAQGGIALIDARLTRSLEYRTSWYKAAQELGKSACCVYVATNNDIAESRAISRNTSVDGLYTRSTEATLANLALLFEAPEPWENAVTVDGSALTPEELLRETVTALHSSEARVSLAHHNT